MSLSAICLPPTSSLPPVRSLSNATEDQIAAALDNLRRIYCPLRLPLAVRSRPQCQSSGYLTPVPADSGYVSENEDDGLGPDVNVALATLRADPFEREFTVRWLTALISRAGTLNVDCENAQADIIDDAASILSSFSDSTTEEQEEALTRDFSFPTTLAAPAPAAIKVQLNDAPLSGTDHTDVGLQSWGASIILSELLCADPGRFRLGLASRIVELGAGTGLISLTLASLLRHLSSTRPTIIATDYHAAVLENLCANLATNFSSDAQQLVQTALLDWSDPCLDPSLRATTDVLIAADVVYAPEHAAWLRDCAARMLAPDGVFWLMVTVRTTGKFEGIADSVEAAFSASECPRRCEDGRVLSILDKQRVEKKRGIGRGDETEYLLFEVGWA